MKKLVLTVAAMLFVPFVTQAEPQGVYFGVGAGQYNVNGTTTPGAYVSAGMALPGIVSGELGDMLGAEVRIGRTTDASRLNVSTKMDYALGAYLTLRFPLADDINLTGAAGLTQSSFTTSALGGLTVTTTGIDLSGAVGAEYVIDERMSVGAEVYHVGGIDSIGATFSFRP